MQTQSDDLHRTLNAHGTVQGDSMLRRLEFDVPELNEAMVQNISKLEAMGLLEYTSIRLHQVTPTLQLLCNLSSLHSLDLSYASITIEDLRCLQECHNLFILDLSDCRGVTDLSPISHIQSLEVVNLSRWRQLIGIGALGRLPRLKELGLKATTVTDDEIQQLSECRTLVKIDLSSSKALTNVNPLSSIATLEVIKLSDCYSLTRMGVLGRFPALKEVHLCRTHIKDEDVRQLSECHTLVKVDLHGCEDLTDVSPLSSIVTLEVINVSCCALLTRVADLGKLPKLLCLDFYSTSVTAEEVHSLTSLREQLGLPSIQIYNCGVDI